ncbi:MAG: hypothetical protein ACT4OG_08320 [Alphaproteobacteria bacterium]
MSDNKPTSKEVSQGVPPYKVPLTVVEAARVGFFTAIWGQIDYFTGKCIAGLLKVEPVAAQTLMEGMTSGPRINLFLRLARKRFANEPKYLAMAKEFSGKTSALIEKRNHLMHGMWGYWVSQEKPHNTTPAVHYAKNPKNPLLVTELEGMIEAALEQAHSNVKISQHLFGFSWEFDPQNPPGFFISDGPRPPNWPADRV